MTLENAKAQAKRAKIPGIPLAIVKEGPHADEFAERDADGQSYGFCPAQAVSYLYKWGEVVETLE